MNDRTWPDVLAHAADDLLEYLPPVSSAATAPAHPDRLKERVMRAARAARAPKSMPEDPFVDFRPGIRWAVTRGADVTLVQWIFEPPACGDLPDESHAFTQSGIVLEGSFSMLYGDGTRHRLSKQDVYSVPAGAVHGAEFHERTVLFDVYTPNHTEFEELYLKQRRERDRTGKTT